MKQGSEGSLVPGSRRRSGPHRAGLIEAAVMLPGIRQVGVGVPVRIGPASLKLGVSEHHQRHVESVPVRIGPASLKLLPLRSLVAAPLVRSGPHRAGLIEARCRPSHGGRRRSCVPVRIGPASLKHRDDGRGLGVRVGVPVRIGPASLKPRPAPGHGPVGARVPVRIGPASLKQEVVSGQQRGRGRSSGPHRAGLIEAPSGSTGRSCPDREFPVRIGPASLGSSAESVGRTEGW